MDLNVLLQALWRKKWILIIVPFFAMCTALAIRLLGDWKYKSSAQLATGLTVSDEVSENGKYLNPYEVQVTFNNLIEIINSRSVMGQVSYRLLEHELKDTVNSFRTPDRKKIRQDIGSSYSKYLPEFRKILSEKIGSLTLLNPNNPQEKQIQKLIDAYGYDYESLIKELFVARLNQSDFIEIAYSSEDPELSAFVVNTICSEFIRYYSAVKVSRINVSIESLESIAAKRKEYLDQKLEALKNFKTSNDVVNSRTESEARMRQLRDYEDQVSDAQQKTRSLELTLANLNVRIKEAELATSRGANDEIVSYRRRINALNERYIQGGQTDNTLLDSVTALRTQLDAIMRRINESPKISPAELRELQNRREETKTELEIARENLASLNKMYNSMRYGLGDFASKEAIGTALEKEVELASQEYLAAQNRLNEAREKMATNKMSISQVLMAEPAEEAESRKTLIFMLFSGALSFVLCAFVIIAIELMDTRIKTPKRFRQMTRMKLAGVLPKLKKTAADGAFTVNGESKHLQRRIDEEVRKIRFEIDKHKGRVLLVTSAKKSQGKSFFIMAIANSLSLLKKRVLIIDTNLRHNSLTKLLLSRSNFKLLLENFSQSTKLLSAPDGSPAEEPSLDQNLISKTANSFIDIIGNKKSQMSPSEVIPGGDFKVLLEWLKYRYDYIILEGPALNLFSDSKELTEFVDLVIPVFSAESAIGTDDVEALNYLKSLQDKLGPAVLNNYQPTK